MKAIGCGHRFLSIIAIFVFVLSAYPVLAKPIKEISYTWDTGRSLKGWRAQDPFAGDLDVNKDFGNPGGSMFATDTAGGGVLWARAPEKDLSGDLTVFTGVYWDEFIPKNNFLEVATFIILEGEDGTQYHSEIFRRDDVVIEEWNTRFEPFDYSDAWFLVETTGNLKFEDVIANVSALFVSMDTSQQNTGAVESYIDNFRAPLVPIPGAVWLLGSGLVGLVIIRKKLRKD